MNEDIDEQGCRASMLPVQHSTGAQSQTDGADKDVDYVETDLVCPQSSSKSLGQRVFGNVAFVN